MRRARLECACELFADWKSLLGQANSRRHHLVERHRAEFVERHGQAGHRARNSHRPRAKRRRFGLQRAVRADVHVSRGSAGSGLAIIKERFAAVRQPHQHEPAAADVARLRQHHGQRKAHGHRRVHGVPTALENFDPRFTGQTLVRDHHRLLRPDRRHRPRRIRSLARRKIALNRCRGWRLLRLRRRRRRHRDERQQRKADKDSWDSVSHWEFATLCECRRRVKAGTLPAFRPGVWVALQGIGCFSCERNAPLQRRPSACRWLSRPCASSARNPGPPTPVPWG